MIRVYVIKMVNLSIWVIGKPRMRGKIPINPLLNIALTLAMIIPVIGGPKKFKLKSFKQLTKLRNKNILD